MNAQPEVTHMSTRSTRTPHQVPSSNVNPIYISCALCASNRVRVKGQRVREKVRICTAESASKFFNAMQAKQDDVFGRCADLLTPEDVFAADIHCHNTSFTRYDHLQSEKHSGHPKTNSKFDAFISFVSYRSNYQQWLWVNGYCN